MWVLGMREKCVKFRRIPRRNVFLREILLRTIVTSDVYVAWYSAQERVRILFEKLVKNERFTTKREIEITGWKIFDDS